MSKQAQFNYQPPVYPKRPTPGITDALTMGSIGHTDGLVMGDAGAYAAPAFICIEGLVMSDSCQMGPA